MTWVFLTDFFRQKIRIGFLALMIYASLC